MAAKKAPLKAKDNKVCKTDYPRGGSAPVSGRPATPVEIAAFGI
jgi:hypothetical protein